MLSIGAHVLRSPPAFISVVLLYVTYVWYFVALVKVFRVIHGVRLIRGTCIVLVGVSLRILFAVWIEAPVVQIFWQAYRTSP